MELFYSSITSQSEIEETNPDIDEHEKNFSQNRKKLTTCRQKVRNTFLSIQPFCSS